MVDSEHLAMYGERKREAGAGNICRSLCEEQTPPEEVT